MNRPLLRIYGRQWIVTYFSLADSAFHSAIASATDRHFPSTTVSLLSFAIVASNKDTLFSLTDLAFGDAEA